MTDIRRVFIVDGKPFYPLGGEADNQSGRSDSESETAFKAVKQLHGNTLEIAVCWEYIEPEEGKFDFSCVDALLTKARRYGIKLILLWFATWFGGTMNYSPAWVKTNPQRFKRLSSPSGKELWALSPHCKANLEADKKAFVALCKYLKAKDCDAHTVIGIQVENEPCIYSNDRDYSPEAQAEYEGPVPAKLVAAMKSAGKGRVYDVWQQAGGKKSGTWPELFGWEAGKFLTAWNLANYIDNVAAAGKTVHDIPMFMNIIPRYYNLQLDIYKWFTPHVDFIGPDVYEPDSRGYEFLCDTYSRDDNPLFLPESVKEVTDGGKSVQPWAIFRAIADYNLIGYFFFGIEYIVAEDGSFRPEFHMLVDSIKCVAEAIPLLLEYQGTGKIRAVAQEEYLKSQECDFDGYTGLVQFGTGQAPPAWKDWRHPPEEMLFKQQNGDGNRGRGLIIQASKSEFYLVGANYRLFLQPKQSTDKMQAPLPVTDPPYLSVDEGHFNQNGKFVIDRQRNGGQVLAGVWVEPDCGVVRVILCD
jgi:hypothetical protein